MKCRLCKGEMKLIETVKLAVIKCTRCSATLSMKDKETTIEYFNGENK